MGSLKAAQALGKAVLDAATAQQAVSSKDAVGAQKDFLAQIDPKEMGKYDGAVNGQDALKASAGTRDLDAAQPVEKFASPVVLMDAPASINWATPASTVLFAGQQLNWTTQGDLQMTAAFTVSSVTANAAGLFTHEGGIQAFAGNGPVSLQAHTDQLEIVADKEIVVISVNDGIEIKAKDKVVLQAGQSSVTLAGGDITFACPGNFTVKGGQHTFDGGKHSSSTLQRLPDTRVDLFDEQFKLVLPGTDEPLANTRYRITTADGQVIDGVTDSEGLTERVHTDEATILALEVFESDLQIQIGDTDG